VSNINSVLVGQESMHLLLSLAKRHNLKADFSVIINKEFFEKNLIFFIVSFVLNNITFFLISMIP
jgi:hypothetical protein